MNYSIVESLYRQKNYAHVRRVYNAQFVDYDKNEGILEAFE